MRAPAIGRGAFVLLTWMAHDHCHPPCPRCRYPGNHRTYVHAVEHGTASFELTPPDEAEMARRMDDLLGKGYPYLIAEDGRILAGYAYAGPYRTRPAYRPTVENSVYIAPDNHRRGVGRALLAGLIEACAARGSGR